MAKTRSPLSGYKYGSIIQEEKRRSASTMASIYPRSTQPKKAVAKAHAKHKDDNTTFTPEPTAVALGARFHALPTELRAHIFSFLLVQRSKWDVEHKPSCKKFTDPNLVCEPFKYPEDSDCPRCGRLDYFCNWHMYTLYYEDFTTARRHPWRSKYAPEVRNQFVCDMCWNRDFRTELDGEFPRRGEMVCLCARRMELDVLLVSRQWSAEAGRVLYAGNTFASEQPGLFTAFAKGCGWHDLVTRVSIVDAWFPQYQDPDEPFQWPDWDFHKKRLAMLQALRRFPALTHLELDTRILNDVRDVRTLLSLGLRNLQSVRFVMAIGDMKANPKYGPMPRGGPMTHHISSRAHERVLLRGGLPEEVGRAMKGDRRRWMRVSGLLGKAVGWQKTLYEGLKKKQGQEGRCGAIVECDDAATWEYLWRKCGAQAREGLVAYLPAAGTVAERHERRSCCDTQTAELSCVDEEEVLDPLAQLPFA